MAHMPSPHSALSSPPHYEKSSINQQDTVRYEQRDPAPRYSQRNQNQSGPAAADSGALGLGTADDKLPPYAPTLQLLTLCRRKNELDRKDRKAKKRSWDLVWLLLDGTALRMYHPTNAESKKFEKEWNEKYCMKKRPVVKKVVAPFEPDEDGEDGGDEEDVIEELATEVHSTGIEEVGSNVRTVNGRGRSSSTAKVPLELASSTRPVPTRIRTNVPIPSTPLDYQTPTSLSTRPALSIPAHPNLQDVLTRKAYISHPVRNIACTRATTYFKRNFVLRYVLEDGKQFLVQLNSHEETLVWQQIMQIAAPLALDIDERSMPDPAPYPRPRRTLERRPSTAPAAIDTALVPHVPPEYQRTTSPSAIATETAGMGRRRRSLSAL